MHNFCTVLMRLAVVAVAIGAGAATAADNLVGHTSSLTLYRGTPSTGRFYRIMIRAGKNGNPETFPLPVNPAANGGWVSVERDGGTFGDPLTAGTWSGIGNPAGSKGWRYRNKSAPIGGGVSLLLFRAKLIKVVARATGTLPVPAAPNGETKTAIVADGEKYCAEATPPYSREVDGKRIASKNQLAPAACPSCLVGVDSDGDRLDDCYETNTGVFVSPTDTGTDPFNADTDGDSIKDGDEVLGTLGGLDLPALGTNPLHKDILVEYDWFDDNAEPGTCSAHSHRPTTATLAMVTATFAAAPVANPDGTTGINFIHDRGQGGVFSGGNLIADADGVLASGVNSQEFVNYKNANFAPNRRGYFHYAILPHRYNTNSSSSGQAELPGNDMIVSLYCFNSDSNVAHTIVHELGHNLFLRHGGFEDCNYKPNYNSVMNYRYQFPGIDTDCTPPGNGVLDYSIGDRISLDEHNLDESMGTCGAPAWDWNGNNVIESGVAFDINPEDESEASLCGGTLTTLRDYDDWSHIWFGGLSNFDGSPVAPPEIIDCTNPPPPILPGPSAD